jgi:hypothetical protein
MKRLVFICILLLGLQHAYTSYANAAFNKIDGEAGVSASKKSPIGDADNVFRLQLTHHHTSSRPVLYDALLVAHHQHSANSAFSIFYYVPYTVFCNAYLDHIYPSHNFW